MLAAISNACRAIAELLGIVRARSDLNNTPTMQANAAAKTGQEVKDDATKAVSGGKVSELEKGISE